MVLSDHEIWMEVQSGKLAFTPEVAWNSITPSSVDLHLGNSFTLFDPPAIQGVTTAVDLATVTDVEAFAASYGNQKELREGERLPLTPGQFLLAYTLERVELPNYLAGRVEGRSSFARLGLSIHRTAPTVHATFEGRLRLEIRNNGIYEVRLSPGLKICQLVLERLGSPAVTRLNSLFQQQGETA